MYRISTVRSNFEQNNLSIEESIGWQLCKENLEHPVLANIKLPDARVIEYGVPCVANKN
jgi:hypothetical protein